MKLNTFQLRSRSLTLKRILPSKKEDYTRHSFSPSKKSAKMLWRENFRSLQSLPLKFSLVVKSYVFPSRPSNLADPLLSRSLHNLWRLLVLPDSDEFRNSSAFPPSSNERTKPLRQITKLIVFPFFFNPAKFKIFPLKPLKC